MKKQFMLIALPLLCVAGCQAAEPPADLRPDVASISVSAWISECPLDISGVDINAEYNGNILDLVTMKINGFCFRTMGFYASIDFVQESPARTTWYAAMPTAVFKGTYLFLRGTDEGIYLLFKGADSGDWPFDMPEITSAYIEGLFDSYKYAFIKIDENNVYVWDELYDFLRDNKVKMPSNYIPVKLWFKPDGDEKGSTQPTTQSATQAITQPKNENGGGEKK